jgi:hypothetical protein
MARDAALGELEFGVGSRTAFKALLAVKALLYMMGAHKRRSPPAKSAPHPLIQWF